MTHEEDIIRRAVENLIGSDTRVKVFRADQEFRHRIELLYLGPEWRDGERHWQLFADDAMRALTPMHEHRGIFSGYYGTVTLLGSSCRDIVRRWEPRLNQRFGNESRK